MRPKEKVSVGMEKKSHTSRLQPSEFLWRLYKPEEAKYRFKANTSNEAKKWQESTARDLSMTVGFQDVPLLDVKPEIVEEVDKGDYIRKKILIHTTEYSTMPVYLLLPKMQEKPLKTVLAFNGHGYGVKDIIGLWEDGTERSIADGYQKDFAVSLCRKGMAVVAPEIFCFGERVTDFSYINKIIGQQEPGTCGHSSFLAFYFGKSVLGFRIFEMKILIDYLQRLPELDPNRIGAMGISGGGMLAFFLTALEQRIRACAISGYFCTFEHSIFAMNHCICNVVPGLHQFGEMYDIAGLIAPRPMLIEAGSRDPIFPIGAVQASVKKVKNIYEVFKCNQNLQTDYFEGRHQISGQKAFDFLKANLT